MNKQYGVYRFVLVVVLIVCGCVAFVPHANAKTNRVILSGSDWLGGSGVDVYSNDGDFSSASADYNTIVIKGQSYRTGLRWQCVELVERLYYAKGWIALPQSGGTFAWPAPHAAREMYNTAPKTLAKEPNGSITSVRAGDVIVLGGGNVTDATGVPAGHVAIVDSVVGNVINTVSQNISATKARAAFTWDTRTKRISSGWHNYTTIGIVHAPSSRTDNNATVHIDNTVRKVIKRTQSDGVNLVYWSKAGSVFESWWRPGGDGVRVSEMIRITQNDITDIDMQLLADGTHQLYTATAHIVWETWWYPGKGKHTTAIVQDTATIKQIQKTVAPDGVHQLYVMSDKGVDEYWWRPGGEGVHKNRLYTLANPVAMHKTMVPDGRHVLYVADRAHAYEVWWRPGVEGITVGEVMHISQADIVDIDFVRDTDGKHRLYVGSAVGGVWEAAWYPGAHGVSYWRVTADNGVRAIQQWTDGGVQVVYVATAGGVFEYWWQRDTAQVNGSVITAQADIHDFDRATTADGAQAIYTAANTRVFESWWLPGGNGIRTTPIA